MKTQHKVLKAIEKAGAAPSSALVGAGMYAYLRDDEPIAWVVVPLLAAMAAAFCGWIVDIDDETADASSVDPATASLQPDVPPAVPPAVPPVGLPVVQPAAQAAHEPKHLSTVEDLDGQSAP